MAFVKNGPIRKTIPSLSGSKVNQPPLPTFRSNPRPNVANTQQTKLSNNSSQIFRFLKFQTQIRAFSTEANANETENQNQDSTEPVTNTESETSPPAETTEEGAGETTEQPTSKPTLALRNSLYPELPERDYSKIEDPDIREACEWWDAHVKKHKGDYLWLFEDKNLEELEKNAKAPVPTVAKDGITPLTRKQQKFIANSKKTALDMLDGRKSEIEDVLESWADERLKYFSDARQEQVWLLFSANRKKWTLARLADRFDCTKEEIAAYIIFKSLEKKRLERGQPSDPHGCQKIFEENYPELVVAPLEEEEFMTELLVPPTVPKWVTLETDLDERFFYDEVVPKRNPWNPKRVRFVGERQGYVSEERESIVIKKGWRTPEEVEQSMARGEIPAVVIPRGGGRYNYPVILQELDGTIRTATSEERLKYYTHGRKRKKNYRNPTLEERVEFWVDDKILNLDPSEDLTRARTKFISLDDYLARKKADPFHNVRHPWLKEMLSKYSSVEEAAKAVLPRHVEREPPKTKRQRALQALGMTEEKWSQNLVELVQAEQNGTAPTLEDVMKSIETTKARPGQETAMEKNEKVVKGTKGDLKSIKAGAKIASAKVLKMPKHMRQRLEKQRVWQREQLEARKKAQLQAQ